MSEEEEVSAVSENEEPEVSENEEPEVAAGEGEKKGRGRPKSSTAKGPYVPSGKPRGRPKKAEVEEDEENEEPEAGVPSGKPIGRPKKAKGRGRPPGPAKPPKSPKMKAAVEKRGRKPTGLPKPTHAPFTKLVTSALTILQLEEKKGASKIAIVKHIMDEEPECADKLKVARSVGKALKKLMAQEVIVAPKGHMGKFKIVDLKSASSPSPKKKKGKGRGKPKPAYVPSGKPRGRPKKSQVSEESEEDEESEVENQESEEENQESEEEIPTKKAKAAAVPAAKARGRPKESTAKPAYVPNGNPRGRKPIGDTAKPAYVPNGKPRGRKPIGDTAKPAYVPSGKPRGRPKTQE